ncbi:MAG: EAL domain-containing protein [Gammaproteobacteria bacterium]|nr:EAL domain-containing protein [Gammaproteobacteria bacterium]
MVSDDVEKRLYLSTVVASLWPDAEVVEGEPDDVEIARTCELVVLHDGAGIAIDWMTRNEPDRGLAVVVVAAHLDDAFTAKVLKLGAMDCVFEGSGYPGNLIHALRAEVQRAVRTHNPIPAPTRPNMDADSAVNRALDSDEDDDHSVSGMLMVSSKGRQVLAGVGADSLGADVSAQIYADGAEVISARAVNGVLRVHIEGMIGLIHAEMIADHIAEFMRDRNARSGQDGGVALGMAVSDYGKRASLANLTGKAEILCEQIRLEGGTGIKVAACKDIKEIEKPEGSDRVGESSEGEVDILHEGIRAVLLAGQLQVNFDPIRGSDGSFSQTQREQAQMRLIDRNGDPWTAERRDHLMGIKGHASSVDRIVVAHALRRLRADKTGNLGVVLDVSQESMRSGQFWRWLAQRLGSPEAQSSSSRLSLTLSLDVLRERHIDPNFLVRFGIARGCHFVLRDIVDVKEALDFAQIVPIQFFALDMDRRRGRSGCEAIKQAVKALHAANRKVALRHIHASADLFCAYSSGADYYHGQLADQWEEVGLVPLDGKEKGAAPSWMTDYKG